MAKSSRVSLTVNRVNGFHADGKGQVFLWDATVPGLGVRATSGSKSFVFERRFQGRTARITIGACSAWKLPEAREEARRLQRLIDQGIDPRKDKADRKAAKEREELLVSDAFQTYLEAHEKKWSKRYMSDYLRLAREPEGDKAGGVLWSLLQMHMSEIDVSTLLSWAKETVRAQEVRLAEVEAVRAEAKARKKKSKRKPKQEGKSKQTRISNIQGRLSAFRHGYVYFRAFWNWACQHEEYGKLELAHPDMFSNRELRGMLPPIKAKNDVLQKGQLSAWFDKVTQINNPVISAYLQTLLLTGARRNELGSLKWEDVDSKWKSLHLADKVEEDGRVIPLTPYVDHLLSTLPKRKGVEWVFISPKSESGRLVEPRIAHNRALAAAKIPPLSLHGLRRSFASLSDWIEEMPAGIVAQIMGHKPSATAERHYKRRPLDLLALWHGKLEMWILEQAGIDFDPEKVNQNKS